MPRESLPLLAADLSSFVKSLRRQLGDHQQTHQALPGHVEMLNMLARAAGHRNVQSLRAASARSVAAGAAPDAPVAALRPAPSSTTSRTSPSAAPMMARPLPGGHARGAAAREQLPPARGPRDPSLPEAADRALRQFDPGGRLMRWPRRRATQQQVLWALWARFDPARRYTEREVNDLLNAYHLFGDHCTLRRELVEMRLLARTPDGAEYRRLRAEPDVGTLALLSRLRARSDVAPAMPVAG